MGAVVKFQIQPLRRNGNIRYAVFDDEGARVSNTYDTQGKASARLRQLLHSAALRQRATDRPCMCCGVTFRSSHKFNRLCDVCGTGTARQPRI